MIEIDNAIKYTLFFFIIISYILFIIKPKCMFDENNNFKHFGLNNKETIFPFWLVNIIIALFIYLLIILNKDNFIGK
jgi:hypothetical protein